MLMNIHELSRLLTVSSSGIYQWVSQRKVPFIKIGRSVRFDSKEIDAWLEAKKVKPKAYD